MISNVSYVIITENTRHEQMLSKLSDLDMITIKNNFVLIAPSYFLFQPVLHDWYNKGCGMCYSVCGMVQIKEPLLLIENSPCSGSSGFLF